MRIIHRDIKPHNFLIGATDETKDKIYEAEEILAVEIDSSLTIDVEHPSHEDSNPEVWEDKLDQLFLLDGEINLLKLKMK